MTWQFTRSLSEDNTIRDFKTSSQYGRRSWWVDYVHRSSCRRTNPNVGSSGEICFVNRSTSEGGYTPWVRRVGVGGRSESPSTVLQGLRNVTSHLRLLPSLRSRRELKTSLWGSFICSDNWSPSTTTFSRTYRDIQHSPSVIGKRTVWRMFYGRFDGKTRLIFKRSYVSNVW